MGTIIQEVLGFKANRNREFIFSILLILFSVGGVVLPISTASAQEICGNYMEYDPNRLSIRRVRAKILKRAPVDPYPFVPGGFYSYGTYRD